MKFKTSQSCIPFFFFKVQWPYFQNVARKVHQSIQTNVVHVEGTSTIPKVVSPLVGHGQSEHFHS